MDINKLPSDIQYYIMSYLDDSPIVYKKLHSDKMEKYATIYHDMMDQPSKAYVISGSCSYTRNKEIDHQIYQFSNYLYLSNKKLLAGYDTESSIPSYMNEKMNTLNIFIHEVIKIFHKKNLLQKFYPGKIEDVIITIEPTRNNEYFKKINKNLTINIDSFS